MESPQSEENLEAQIKKIVQSELQKAYAKMQELSPSSPLIVQSGGTATYTTVYTPTQLSSASPSPSPSPCRRLRTPMSSHARIVCRCTKSCVSENPHESATTQNLDSPEARFHTASCSASYLNSAAEAQIHAASCSASHMNSTTEAQIHGKSCDALNEELTTTQASVTAAELPPLEDQQSSPLTKISEGETAISAPEVRSRHRIVVWCVFAITLLVSCMAIASANSFVAQVKPLSATISDGSHNSFLHKHFIVEHSIRKLEFKDFRVPKKYQELFLQGYRKMGQALRLVSAHFWYTRMNFPGAALAKRFSRKIVLPNDWYDSSAVSAQERFQILRAAVNTSVADAANFSLAGSSKPINKTDDDLATDRTKKDPATSVNKTSSFARHDDSILVFAFLGHATCPEIACATCCWVLQGQGETSWVESQEGASGVDDHPAGFEKTTPGNSQLDEETEEENEDGFTVPGEVVKDEQDVVSEKYVTMAESEGLENGGTEEASVTSGDIWLDLFPVGVFVCVLGLCLFLCGGLGKHKQRRWINTATQPNPMVQDVTPSEMIQTPLGSYIDYEQVLVRRQGSRELETTPVRRSARIRSNSSQSPAAIASSRRLNF